MILFLHISCHQLPDNASWHARSCHDGTHSWCGGSRGVGRSWRLAAQVSYQQLPTAIICCCPMMADTPPTSPPPNPKQGWPLVPSPKGSADKAGRSPVDAQVRADLAARRRVIISPRSAALLKQAAQKKGNKFAPGPLPNQLAPAFKTKDQCLSEPAPGPSPNGKGKWRPKSRVGAAAGRRRSMLKLNTALGRSADQNGSANGAADSGNSDGGNSGAASSDNGEVNANARDNAGGGARWRRERFFFANYKREGAEAAKQEDVGDCAEALHVRRLR